MVTKTSGKRDNQKLKTYLILQYFLQYSDERHPLRMQDILLHLQNGAFGPSDWIRTEQPAGGGLLAAAFAAQLRRRYAEVYRHWAAEDREGDWRTREADMKHWKCRIISS